MTLILLFPDAKRSGNKGLTPVRPYVCPSVRLSNATAPSSINGFFWVLVLRYLWWSFIIKWAKICKFSIFYFFRNFFKFWLKWLLLLHFLRDLFEILHMATCGHHQQWNRARIGNLSFLNFLEFFYIYFLKIYFNRYSSFISLQILLKICTVQLRDPFNNEIEQ